MSVEVKIGIVDSPRELSVQVADDSEKTFESVASALSGKADLLTLVDDRGSRFLIPSSKIAYAEVGSADAWPEAMYCSVPKARDASAVVTGVGPARKPVGRLVPLPDTNAVPSP